MPPVSPARISLPDRYRVIRHIANGGMASVWEAHDELLDRAVAVKLLATHLSEDDRARTRFQREARAAAGLSSHPHVVTIYDVGEHAGRTFMVMELMRGGSVADVLKRDEPITHERSLRWLEEAAGALDTAHDAGVVHRDIKPANLLLDDRDRLAVGDYGIARLAWEEQVTQTGQVLGTAAYISPEQAMGHPAVAASDRYALAIVAFELLTGEKPFNAEHFAAQARAHVEDEPPPASERAPDLNSEVDEVLAKGMAKEPEDRWGSSAELADRLRGAVESGARPAAAAVAPVAPTRATRRMETEERTPAPAVAAAPPRRDPPPPRDPDRSPNRNRRGPGRGLAALGGLAALLLIGILGVVLLGGGDGDRQQPSTNSSAENTESEKTPTPTPSATETAEPEATAEATAEPTAEPTAEAKKPSAKEPAGNNPTTLQLQAFRLNNAGNPEEALPVAQKAVRLSCKDGASVSPCGYALFELAKAQRGTGDPEGAIKSLEDRQRRFPDDQKAAVDAELARAKADAGQ